MNLLEFQAKKLLIRAEIPVPRSWVAKNATHVPSSVVYPVVAKSQVPVGGRGKAGGVVVVKNETELRAALPRLFALAIKGHLPKAVLLEELLDIERELYLAIRLNRDTKYIEIMASPHSGMDIEEAPEKPSVYRWDGQNTPDELFSFLATEREKLGPILETLLHKFVVRDLTLCEINPLVITKTGEPICADAKVTVDDNARFRQPNFPWPETTSANMRVLSGGTIGCIANGAGMAMSTMDTIVSAGGKPANFLDIGGGTGEKEFVAALKQISDLPGVTSIIVNIFAGISRCDEIARGLIAAKKQLPNLQPIFVRLEGTNRDLAVELLKPTDIVIEPDLKTCIKKAISITPADRYDASVTEASAFPAATRQDPSVVSAEWGSVADGSENGRLPHKGEYV